MEMGRLTQDGTAELVEQDWQLYPVDLYSCRVCDHTYYIPVRATSKGHGS